MSLPSMYGERMGDLIDITDYSLPDSVERYNGPDKLPSSADVLEADGVMSDHQHYVTPEVAFKAYALQPDRSLRKLADVLAVPRGTILGWSSKYGWKDRIRELDLERVEGITETVAVILVQQAVNNLETLIEIRDDLLSSPKVRMDAAKELTMQFNRMQDRAMLSRLTGTGDEEFLEDHQLAALAQTADGVNQLLQHLRNAT